MINNKFIISFAILFLFFVNNSIAQDSNMLKRKLKFGFSLYCISSYCNLKQVTGDKIAECPPQINSGNSLHLIYDINTKHSVSLRLNYFRVTFSINYVLDYQKYSLPFEMYGPLDYTAHIVSPSLNYIYSYKMSENLFLYTEIGYMPSFPIILNADGMSAYFEDGSKNIYLETEYYPETINGLLLNVGFQKPLQKNELRLTILGHIPFQSATFGKFTFFPDDQKNVSSGMIKSGLCFVGLNISYILTHKKKK